MSAVGAKPGGSAGIDPVASIIAIVLMFIMIGIMYMLGAPMTVALIGIIIGGILVGFGVMFVPVGGAPAAMGQAPGIATGVAMLAAGAGLAGLFGGAWAAETSTPLVAIITGAVGGGLMMAITCLFVNFIYVYGMGIPAASGKVKKDPITGDTQT
jgi:tetrahydromethanopterin S-methyltransferase subunit D